MKKLQECLLLVCVCVWKSKEPLEAFFFEVD